MKEGFLAFPTGRQRSQQALQQTDCPRDLAGQYLPLAVAGVEAFQCSVLALIKAVRPAVAAVMQESEVCLAREAGVFERLVMSEGFEEAEEFGSVLVSLWTWLHSEEMRWSGLLWKLAGRWGEAQRC